MSTIIIKKEMYKLDNKLLQDLGYSSKGNTWSKSGIDIPAIRKELEKLRILKITGVEILLD